LDGSQLRAEVALQPTELEVFSVRGSECRMPHEFTPWTALAGGALIGLAASVLLAVNGRVAGVSSAIGGLISPTGSDRSWRAFFLSGLALTGFLSLWLAPGALGHSPRTPLTLIIAGLLVGVGTTLGSGCTSGHGVCGISRLSPRSMLATAIFVICGMLSVAVFRVLGGVQ
jgi:uncharacterized membrane protein YedE/YeeE